MRVGQFTTSVGREGDEPEEPNDILRRSAGKELAATDSDVVLKFIGQLSHLRSSLRELFRPTSLPHT